MKSILTFLIFLLSLSATYAQIISSCNAPDSIEVKYRTDADCMGLRRILNTTSTYKDSVVIPSAWSDTALNALMAVYNATTLPASDSVTGRVHFILNSFAGGSYPIHASPNPNMHSMDILADSSLPWMEQLKAGNSLSGNNTIDNLITRYHLTVEYFALNYFAVHEVEFKADSDYNMSALVNLFKPIYGITDAEVESSIGGGGDIKDSIYPNFVDLIYYLGVGDCPSGCTAGRIWEFHVYYDCSVSFITSYGTSVLNAVNNINDKPIGVFPSPFSTSISITGLRGEFNFQLYNMYGQLTASGYRDKSSSLEFNNIPAGLYFLQIKNGTTNSVFKLVKE